MLAWERNTRESLFVRGLYHLELPGNLPLRGFAPGYVLVIVSHLAAMILAIEGQAPVTTYWDVGVVVQHQGHDEGIDQHRRR